MSSEHTPNLGLPYLAAAQSQKHVTHNEAIRALDALVQLSVRTRTLVSPPVAPQEGQRWIVGAPASAAWSGREGMVAAFQDGAWAFLAPNEGWLAWVSDEGKLLAWNGTHWIDGAAPVTSLNPAPLVGVNATADATNRLAVKSDASLFDNEGHGHQLKLNKASAPDTASVLFQDAYAGRAEVGLCGDDNFHFKVSADGSTWKDAIQIDRATGAVSLPFTTLASPYTLPSATGITLGGVKQGSNVAIAADGTLTVPPASFDASGAAAAAQAFATQRSNHTGTQPVSTITGLAAVATSGSYADLAAKPSLGTAAALDVGTLANNVVQLTAAGKLPAVDGSQLTNLPPGSGQASFTAPNPATAPVKITAATGQTANLLEFTTPGISPLGARSYFDKYGSFATQAWMTISGMYVTNPDGSINQVIYPGGSPGVPQINVANRLTGGGSMLGVSNDIVGPGFLSQDNLNKYFGGGYKVAVRAAVAAGGTGYAVGDVLTAAGGTSVAATTATLDGVNPTVRGTGYTAGDVLTVVGGVGTAATITVNTVDGSGRVLTATLTTTGNYSVNPDFSVNTTGGTGTNAYFYITWPTRGPTKLTVTSVAGGVITGLAVSRPGYYSALPSNPVTLTGGTGTGATATLTWSERPSISRHADFLDYRRYMVGQIGYDGMITLGNAQDVEQFAASNANLKWVDNDTLGSDATFKPAALTTAGIGTIGNTSIYKASRDVASGSDKTTAIGSFYLTDSINPIGCGAFTIMVTTYAGGFSTSKIYQIPVSYGLTSGAWQQVVPIGAALQPGYSNEVALDFNVSGATVSFRLRNTVAAAVHCEVSIISSAPRDRASFTADTTTASGVTAPATIYSGKPATSIDLVTKSFVVPTTGTTVTIPQGCLTYLVNPAGSLAALTVAMQSGMVDGQRQVIVFKQAITSQSFTATGASMDWTGGTAVAANQRIEFIYDAPTFKWWRVQ